jgi:pantetheine-phosphate adenylyltransferase
MVLLYLSSIIDLRSFHHYPQTISFKVLPFIMTSPILSPRIAVYPGSFDPITLGHLNVMDRASKLFDRLIVGVGVNIEKLTLFSAEERMQLMRDATAHLENVEIRTFNGLAVAFVKQCGARIMIRGVRPITDIAAELTMMMANRRLDPDVETLFMIADGDLAHVSSSLIKQIATVADEKELSRFLPPNVVKAVRARVEREQRRPLV